MWCCGVGGPTVGGGLVDDHELIIERGTSIIDDPDRLGEDVEAVGVDETWFLRATGKHPTWFATGITDLSPGRPA